LPILGSRAEAVAASGWSGWRPHRRTGKTGHALGRTRYFGEARVAGDCHAFAIACNLRRALGLV